MYIVNMFYIRDVRNTVAMAWPNKIATSPANRSWPNTPITYHTLQIETFKYAVCLK